jgi:putative ABC transport system permease protein
VRDAVLAASDGKAKVALVDRSTDELDAFRASFYVISLLVLAVSLVNLLGTTLLGIRERIHDIGVLKTIGFTPWQMATSTAAGAAAYALAAVAIGIPLGLVVSSAMLNTVGRSTGLGPGYGSAPAVAALLVTGLAIVTLGALMGAIAARGAARAPVADILRSE